MVDDVVGLDGLEAERSRSSLYERKMRTMDVSGMSGCYILVLVLAAILAKQDFPALKSTSASPYIVQNWSKPDSHSMGCRRIVWGLGLGSHHVGVVYHVGSPLLGRLWWLSAKLSRMRGHWMTGARKVRWEGEGKVGAKEGWRKLPRPPMGETKRRLSGDQGGRSRHVIHQSQTRVLMAPYSVRISSWSTLITDSANLTNVSIIDEPRMSYRKGEIDSLSLMIRKISQSR